MIDDDHVYSMARFGGYNDGLMSALIMLRKERAELQQNHDNAPLVWTGVKAELMVRINSLNRMIDQLQHQRNGSLDDYKERMGVEIISKYRKPKS